MALITTLPTELLTQIIAPLSPADLKSLRATSHIFRGLLIPRVLKTIRLYNPFNSSQQLAALADRRSITAAAAAVCTDTLVLTFAAGDDEDGETAAQVLAAVGMLRACRTVIISTAPKPLTTAPQKYYQLPAWAVTRLPFALEQLTALRTLEITYPAGFRAALDLSRFSHRIEALKLSVHPGLLSPPAAMRALVASAGGTWQRSLDFDTGLHGDRGVRPVLCEVIRSCGRDLRVLRANGVVVDDGHFGEAAKGLERVWLGKGVRGDVDGFFEALGRAGTRLRAVDVPVLTRGVVRYLEGYTGLEEVVVRGEIGWEDVAGMLAAHGDSLRVLEVEGAAWGYDDMAAELVRGNQRLTRLAVAVGAGRVMQLLEDVSRLPRFDTLVIDCMVPAANARFSWSGEVSALEAAVRAVQSKITEFVPLPGSSIRAIRMRWGGREEFRRAMTPRGERFVCGGVGKDGVWREVREGEMVDRDGMLRRRDEAWRYE